MGISAWQILILLLIVVLLFGTKKLRNMGGDLGEAVKGFKAGIKDTDTNDNDSPVSIEHSKKDTAEASDAQTIDADFAKSKTSAS